MADFINPPSPNERLAHVEANLDSMRDQLHSLKARRLSLENWMRTLSVTLGTVAVGVTVQIVLILVKS